MSEVNNYEGQIDIFPKASEEDKKRAKELLSRYIHFVRMKDELEKRASLSLKQQSVLDECKRNIADLESAVNLIADQDVREVMQYRYIIGNSWKLTIIHFSAMMDDRTIGRKINKGIELVAEALLIY